MQSLHNLANYEHGRVLYVGAWPGVLPSSFEGGEASAAQEPQPEATQEDDSELEDSEATPEILEPFIPKADKESDPATQEDITEATPQASLVSTPVLETTTPQGSLVGMLVLNLTDEEDAMDQDPPQDH